ncbi:unnamed protein product, partial [Ectocarpus sp. 4 AP-2014]
MPLISSPPPTAREEADVRWVLPQSQPDHHSIDARSNIGQPLPSTRGSCPRRVCWRGERGRGAKADDGGGIVEYCRVQAPFVHHGRGSQRHGVANPQAREMFAPSTV